MKTNTENIPSFLINYPFSLLDIEGSLKVWQEIYNPYIDLIEDKINNLKKKSISIFRNHNFAFNNAVNKRIADLIVCEIEERGSNPVSNKNVQNLNKQREIIEEKYSDVLEHENYNVKLTFILTHKRQHPLKLMQFLKLTGEVKNFTELLHKKEFKEYSEVIPQVILISLYGFEASIGEHLRDNPHGKLQKNISILVVPPIEKNLWNNYYLEKSMEGKDSYVKHKSGINFEDYNNLRKNGGANQYQVKNMENYYRDQMKSKRISDYNFQQVNFWTDILSINNPATLIDIKNSREKINKLIQ